MLISFFVYFNKNLVDVVKTINSIKKQTSDNYEIIVINDAGYAQGNDLNDYIEEESKVLKKKIKLIISSSSQGYTYVINNAISSAAGEYVLLAPPGGISYSSDLCKKIETKLKDSKPDLVELMTDLPTKSKIKYNKTYLFKDTKSILTMMDFSLHNKLFKKKVIEKNNLTFLNYSWYLQLFLYQFTFYSKDFAIFNINIGKWKQKQLSYSIFELSKQWVKIFNWYRGQEKINDYREELDYSYTKYLLLDFLPFVKEFYSKSIYNKAINEVRIRLKRRCKYINKNKYILENEKSDLSQIILKSGINEYLRRI